jgi:hypothetical protein
VIVYVEPGVTEKPVPVLSPPAPPPPPYAVPPEPPPAITRYSTCVAPVGAVHVPDDVNVARFAFAVAYALMITIPEPPAPPLTALGPTIPAPPPPPPVFTEAEPPFVP